MSKPIPIIIRRRHKVDTTAFISVGYDCDTNTLAVEFPSKKVYRYQNVTPVMFATMMNAESIGTWFQTNIVQHREKYPFTAYVEFA